MKQSAPQQNKNITTATVNWATVRGYKCNWMKKKVKELILFFIWSTATAVYITSRIKGGKSFLT